MSNFLDDYEDNIEVDPSGNTNENGWKSPDSKSKSVENYDVEKNQTQYFDDDLDADDANANGAPRQVDNLFADLSCWCVPRCATRPREICGRTGMWFLANSDQFISSIIVAINLIPEAISYALMAGLPPTAALQSCWIVNIITSLVGGRPGMISSASGLIALLLHRLVQTTGITNAEDGSVVTGVMFVPYAIMFAGALQMISAFFGLGRLASRFPAPVVVGMVNAMALLLLALQGRYAKDFPLSEQDLEFMPVAGSDAAVEIDWNIALFSYFGKGFDWIGDNLNLGVYGGEVALSLLISMFLPRFTTFFPATLVSVLVIVGVEFGIARQFGVETPLIGDYGGSQVSEKWSTSGASDVLTVLPLLHVLTSIEHFLHSHSLLFSLGP